MDEKSVPIITYAYLFHGEVHHRGDSSREKSKSLVAHGSGKAGELQHQTHHTTQLTPILLHTLGQDRGREWLMECMKVV